jgi:hypothetical protein
MAAIPAQRRIGHDRLENGRGFLFVDEHDATDQEIMAVILAGLLAESLAGCRPLHVQQRTRLSKQISSPKGPRPDGNSLSKAAQSKEEFSF